MNITDRFGLSRQYSFVNGWTTQSRISPHISVVVNNMLQIGPVSIAHPHGAAWALNVDARGQVTRQDWPNLTALCS